MYNELFYLTIFFKASNIIVRVLLILKVSEISKTFRKYYIMSVINLAKRIKALNLFHSLLK